MKRVSNSVNRHNLGIAMIVVPLVGERSRTVRVLGYVLGSLAQSLPGGAMENVDVLWINL